MDGPEIIFIDRRVASTIKTEPDDHETDIQYFHWKVVRDMVQQSQGPSEFFVNICQDNRRGLWALTNYGRLFRMKRDEEGALIWTEHEVPEIPGPGL